MKNAWHSKRWRKIVPDRQRGERIEPVDEQGRPRESRDLDSRPRSVMSCVMLCE